MHTVHKNYLHLYSEETSGQCCDNQRRGRPTTLLLLNSAVLSMNKTMNIRDPLCLIRFVQSLRLYENVTSSIASSLSVCF